MQLFLIHIIYCCCDITISSEHISNTLYVCPCNFCRRALISLFFKKEKKKPDSPYQWTQLTKALTKYSICELQRVAHHIKTGARRHSNDPQFNAAKSRSFPFNARPVGQKAKRSWKTNIWVLHPLPQGFTVNHVLFWREMWQNMQDEKSMAYWQPCQVWVFPLC